jgi:hypothetical protein
MYAALSLAKQKGWYCRFDHTLNERLTCDDSHPDAKLDLIRGLVALKRGDPRA